jgi:hypothetical protein
MKAPADDLVRQRALNHLRWQLDDARRNGAGLELRHMTETELEAAHGEGQDEGSGSEGASAVGRVPNGR